MKFVNHIRKRGLALFLALAMCLSLLPATALAGELGHFPAGHNQDGWVCAEITEPACGRTAHTHDSTCTPPACGLEEHAHKDDCYDAEGVLICGLEEHDHKDDPAAEPCTLEEHTHDQSCETTRWMCVFHGSIRTFQQAMKAIPETVTADGENTVQAARAAYEALDEEEKAQEQVSELLPVLEKAEEALEEAGEEASRPARIPQKAPSAIPEDVRAFLDAVEKLKVLVVYEDDGTITIPEAKMDEVDAQYGEILDLTDALAEEDYDREEVVAAYMEAEAIYDAWREAKGHHDGGAGAYVSDAFPADQAFFDVQVYGDSGMVKIWIAVLEDPQNGLPGEPGFTTRSFKRIGYQYTISNEGYDFSHLPSQIFDKALILASPDFVQNTDGRRIWGIADPTGDKTKAVIKTTDGDTNDGINWDKVLEAVSGDPQTQEIIPYVVKYQDEANDGPNKGWHIDCVVIPKARIQVSYVLNLPDGISTPGTTLNVPAGEYTTNKTLTFTVGQLGGATTDQEISGAKYNNEDAHLKFLGWSTDPNAEVPEEGFTPGKENVSIQETTILYGVWSYTGKVTAKPELKVTKTIDFISRTVNGQTVTYRAQEENLPACAQVGDKIRYLISIENTGLVDAVNVKPYDVLTIGAPDASGESLTTKQPDNWEHMGRYELVIPPEVTILAGRSLNVYAYYTVLESDAGKRITNTAVMKDLNGQDIPQPEDAAGKNTVTIDVPKLSVTKEITQITRGSGADTQYLEGENLPAYAQVGDVIQYTITVKNEGEVPSTREQLEDVMTAGDETRTITSWSGERGNGSAEYPPYIELQPNAEVFYYAYYTVTPADLGKTLVNTASIPGMVTPDPEDPKNEAKIDVPAYTVNKALTKVERGVGTSNPQTFEGDKLPSSVKARDRLTYTITVTNTGNTELKDIVLADSLGEIVFDASSADNKGKGVTYNDGKFTIASISAKADDTVENPFVTFTYTYDVPTEKAGDKVVNTVTTGDDPRDATPETEEGKPDLKETKTAVDPLLITKFEMRMETGTGLGYAQQAGASLSGITLDSANTIFEINRKADGTLVDVIRLLYLLRVEGEDGASYTIADSGAEYVETLQYNQPLTGFIQGLNGRNSAVYMTFKRGGNGYVPKANQEPNTLPLTNTATITATGPATVLDKDCATSQTVAAHTVIVKYVADDGADLTHDNAPVKEYGLVVANGGNYDVQKQIFPNLTGAKAGESANYTLDTITGNATGSNVTEDIRITLVYSKDVVGGDPDPDKTPDTIPDKYQVKVTFQVENGFWNKTEGSADNKNDVIAYLPKYAVNEDGEYIKDSQRKCVFDENGAAKLAEVDIPAVGQNPAAGYIKAGRWTLGDPNTKNVVEPAKDTITEDTVYVYYYTPEGEMTVSASGYTGVYDGREHADLTDFKVLDANGVDITDKVTVTYTVDGSAYIRGSVKNVTDSKTIHIKVEYPDYKTQEVDAEVRITPVTLTITTEGGRQTYNGRALTNGRYTVDGLAEADQGFSVRVTGSQTQVGTSKNTCEPVWGGVLESNYAVRYDLGDLVVTERPYVPDPTPDPTPSRPTPPPTPIPDDPTPADPGTDINDEATPLAGAVGLNDVDHFAYIVGYDDNTVRPTNNITRAEVATIFFRLMEDDFRAANWATENSFSDVSVGQWYNNAISTCEKAGALGGYEDGSFKPENPITRAEFAVIASRFLSEEYTDEGVGDFSDTANHWAAKEIRRAVKAGWITGDGNQFRPEDPITRAEVMTIVNRMLDRLPDAEHFLPDMIHWIDNPEGTWYYEAVQEATNEHDYERDELNAETWTLIKPHRDWSALEKEWADAYAG